MIRISHRIVCALANIDGLATQRMCERGAAEHAIAAHESDLRGLAVVHH